MNSVDEDKIRRALEVEFNSTITQLEKDLTDMTDERNEIMQELEVLRRIDRENEERAYARPWWQKLLRIPVQADFRRPHEMPRDRTLVTSLVDEGERSRAGPTLTADDWSIIQSALSTAVGVSHAEADARKRIPREAHFWGWRAHAAEQVRVKLYHFFYPRN